jgi:hypothetical protein
MSSRTLCSPPPSQGMVTTDTTTPILYAVLHHAPRLRRPGRLRHPCYPFAMLVNFTKRDTSSIHCLAAEAKTPVSGWVTVRDDSTLLRLFRACGAADANMLEIQRDMERWGRGGKQRAAL